jgi:hypothetical protein
VAEPEGPKKPARARLSVSKTTSEAEPATDAPTPTAQADPRAATARGGASAATRRARQNLALGALGGFLAAVVGVMIWGVVTLATGVRTGYMAIAVGVLVAIAVRALGQGVDRSFARVGAGLALIGCFLGTCMHGCILLAQTEEVALLMVLRHLRLEAIDGLMITTFEPWDGLFYGVAVVLAYRFSRGRIKRTKGAPATR